MILRENHGLKTIRLLQTLAGISLVGANFSESQLQGLGASEALALSKLPEVRMHKVKDTAAVTDNNIYLALSAFRDQIELLYRDNGKEGNTLKSVMQRYSDA
jgi:hypothetical protein